MEGNQTHNKDSPDVVSAEIKPDLPNETPVNVPSTEADGNHNPNIQLLCTSWCVGKGGELIWQVPQVVH